MTGVIVTILVVWMGVPDDADVRGAVHRVYEDQRLQQEWPSPRPLPPAEEPSEAGGRVGGRERVDDRAPEARGRRPEIRLRDDSSDSGSATPLAKAILWILVAVGGAWLLVALVRAIAANRRDVKAPASPPAPMPAAAARSAVPLTPAEVLAAEGRYDEAIHALWLDALRVIGRAADPALTSREVLDRLELAPARRRAAGDLVGAVEVSLFGGRPAGEAEWRACAASHRVATAAGAPVG